MLKPFHKAPPHSLSRASLYRQPHSGKQCQACSMRLAGLRSICLQGSTLITAAHRGAPHMKVLPHVRHRLTAPPPPYLDGTQAALDCAGTPPRGGPTTCAGCPAPAVEAPPPLTMDTVRQNCVTISGIKDQDLLYFSHSNVALSHLPYMVALDR